MAAASPGIPSRNPNSISPLPLGNSAHSLCPLIPVPDENIRDAAPKDGECPCLVLDPRENLENPIFPLRWSIFSRWKTGITLVNLSWEVPDDPAGKRPEFFPVFKGIRMGLILRQPDPTLFLGKKEREYLWLLQAQTGGSSTGGFRGNPRSLRICGHGTTEWVWDGSNLRSPRFWESWAHREPFRNSRNCESSGISFQPRPTSPGSDHGSMDKTRENWEREREKDSGTIIPEPTFPDLDIPDPGLFPVPTDPTGILSLPSFLPAPGTAWNSIPEGRKRHRRLRP